MIHQHQFYPILKQKWRKCHRATRSQWHFGSGSTCPRLPSATPRCSDPPGQENQKKNHPRLPSQAAFCWDLENQFLGVLKSPLYIPAFLPVACKFHSNLWFKTSKKESLIPPIPNPIPSSNLFMKSHHHHPHPHLPTPILYHHFCWNPIKITIKMIKIPASPSPTPF